MTEEFNEEELNEELHTEISEEDIQDEMDENDVRDSGLNEKADEGTDEGAKEGESSEESPEEATDEASEEKTESSQSTEESVVVSKEQFETLNNKYIRLHAEFDNFRRRTAKEVLEIRETANAGLMEKLTEVIDNFERAFSEEHQSDDMETFRKGILLIQEQFSGILRDGGLEVINPVGEEFDPTDQEAVMQQPSDDVEEGHVATVFQKGYKVKEKVIRTAKVIVSSGKA